MKVAILSIIAVMMLTLTACNKANHTASTNPASADVATRQALMKDWRSANDIIKGMIENPANFDTTLLQEQSRFLADSSAMWRHFDDQNAKGNATDAIWSDPTGFKAAKDKYDAAATALNAAAQTATNTQDIEALVGQVGESCGGCHKAYKR